MDGIITAMPTIVSLDIETTGLDPLRDAVIEIGAVRFNGNRVEREWSTLINPNRIIPPQITQLTGITNEMVRTAPPLQAVLHELADFAGQAPIVGHSVHFDLSFLQPHQILNQNDVLDTYELASVLLPTSSRYNLSALGQQLGIIVQGAHRALNDAQTTRSVFLRLQQMAMEIPLDLLAEFIRSSEPLEWGAAWLFRQVFKTRVQAGERFKQPNPHPIYGALFTPPSADEIFAPLSPVISPEPLDIEETAAILEHGGPFSRYFSSYEQRPQQVEMLRSVANALSNDQHLMVEAGTGTGKSFAYLIPAAIWAVKNEWRVVISTNTINLQDQLIKKDIPDLRNALGLNLHAAVLKGRANYLCPRRLEVLRQRGPETAEEMRVLAKILVWLWENGSGDRNEINLNGPIERDIWLKLCADDEACKGEVCTGRMGGICPFFRAREAAQSAHILIVNHALLLADVATGSRVLPEYKHLIIDEAHHLESATTSSLSYRLTQFDLLRLMRELGGTGSGILGHLALELNGLLAPADYAAFRQMADRATDLAFRFEFDLKNFYSSLNEFLADQREGRPVSGYGQQERIQPSTRTQPGWAEIEIAWDTAHETCKLLLNLMEQVYKTISDLDIEPSEELENDHGNLGDLYRRLGEADLNIGRLVSDPDKDYIYWIELSSNGSALSINIAPLHIGPLVEQFLWHEKSSVILTSATLTTENSFDYLRERLSADEADEMTLGSPFDYESSALLYLVNDIPEPADAANYQRNVEETLIRLAKATGGRMLALFTSYAQLKKTSQKISPALAEADIQVYEQGEGASPNTLLETFREADKAVLLGTRAFWEGVDIPGEALSILVIIKLPFDVPSDPIVAARSETYEDAFNQYQLPEAILRFRQGFGRLIRTQSDRGVVAILDRRVLSKRYGKEFIQSLPQCTVRVDSLRELPRLAARWLNL